MKNKTAIALLSLLLSIPFVGTANAALINLDTGVYYTLGGTAVPGNIDLQSLTPNTTILANYNVSGVQLSVVDAAIVTGNTTSGLFTHIMPSGITNSTNYLAVFGQTLFGINLFTGRATFTLGSGVNTFAFNWGSIDAYNTLKFVDGNNNTYTIKGSDLLNNVAGLTAGKSSEFISITALSGIKEVILSSTRNAFEVASVSVSNVPLPAALPLFGTGLLGLYGLKRRKSKKGI